MKIVKAPNLNYLWANLLIEELIRNGVRVFIITPGSRSAPLAVAAYKNPNASSIVHFDERGAAYFALGCARAGSPAAVICTSGTAVTNCLPAVAEACQSALPLLILSADRPPELQDCGANQTIPQEGIFAPFVRAQLNLPCPDKHIHVEALLAKVDALGPHISDGPVHINCMFREPLAPLTVAKDRPERFSSGLAQWESGSSPFTLSEKPLRTLSPSQCVDLSNVLSAAKRGILLIGRLLSPVEQEGALCLANKLGWPVFADITSGCRRPDVCSTLIRHYDLLLCSEQFRKQCDPDLVLHIGDTFVSKRLQEHLRSLDTEYVHLSSRKENRDPLHRVTKGYQVDIEAVAAQLTTLSVESKSGKFLEKCKAADIAVEEGLAQVLSEKQAMNELFIARMVDSALDENSALFLGNSMPVRDMDMMAVQCRSATIHANRGVSGIDGNIATAAGMGWASGERVVAILGDTAVLHDLNSLALLLKNTKPVILVIINNRGGGIFSFLPIAAHEDVLGPCFTNPHEWNFKHAAAMFEIDYEHVITKEDFQKALRRGIKRKSSGIIEITVDRETNVKIHNQCYQAISEWVDNAVHR